MCIYFLTQRAQKDRTVQNVKSVLDTVKTTKHVIIALDCVTMAVLMVGRE